jgi:exoribonuclease R
VTRKFFNCLTPAEYIVTNDLAKDTLGHYALNFPLYTHFTSPIRRYADLVVHRLLSIALQTTSEDFTDYTEQATICTERALKAKRASDACQRVSKPILNYSFSIVF